MPGTARTHLALDHTLSGTPTLIGDDGSAEVSLTTTAQMAADARGLVHGGFVFSAADHAAMLAVNDPLVVLGKAEVKFLAPCRVGDVVVLRARVASTDGKKRVVDVEGLVGSARVFAGTFTCIVPDRHVLG